MPRAVQIDPRSLPDDTPMKLQVLARAAFPDGSVTAAGLRREAEAGRLVTYLVAGVTMTTMAAIRDMVEMCRVTYEDGGDGRRRPAAIPSSVDGEAGAAQAAFLMRLARLGASKSAASGVSAARPPRRGP